jgi:SAM-dependent methyltransferase
MPESKADQTLKSCERTLFYYENNAEEYADKTRQLNLERAYDRFLKNLPMRGRVMDLGVGSGRDSKLFMDRGLQVFPVEASQAMALEAQKLIKMPVHVARMQDLQPPSESLDGIWASASMLHLNPRDFVQTLQMAFNSLRKGGVFYLSLKTNNMSQEFVDENGRYFFLWNRKELLRVIESTTGFRIVEDWDNPDANDRPNTLWTNLVLKKI